MCFFFNDTATTEIYTLSLHDALPISTGSFAVKRGFWEKILSSPDKTDVERWNRPLHLVRFTPWNIEDRKSTRLNSSHANISYAVFCLKKKNANVKVYVYDGYIFPSSI